MRLGAFVLHYRHWPGVKSTIDALLTQTRPPDHLLVVDNGSGDGSPAEIRLRYPELEVLEVPVNRGPIAGMNVGLAAMLERGFDAIMMATHELALAPDAVEQLAARLEEKPQLGAVGPLVGYLGDAETVFSAGGRLDRRDWFAHHPDRGTQVSAWRGAPPRQVEWLDGSCIMMRAEAIRELGPFFEGFYFLYDEADFLFRLRERGWVVECVPSAVSWQDHGTLSPYVWVRNRLGLVARNGSKAELAREALRSVYQLLRSVPHAADPASRVAMHASARGLADFVRGRWGPPPPDLESRWRHLESMEATRTMPETTEKTPYSRSFYEYQSEDSYRSARAIVPLVLALHEVGSVVDVGCGVGTWLAAFAEHGVTDVAGVDGDHVPAAELRIPPERFRPHDLRVPLDLGRRFDLAVCLEVAEHLPPDAGSDLVDTLTGLAPVVLFSAAAPEQGGVGHVNEQWPSYWIERFATRGYEAVDCIRPQVWDDDEVVFWYAQNTFLMVDRATLAVSPALREARDRYAVVPKALVHPTAYRERTRYATDPGLHAPRALLAAMVKAVRRSLHYRLQR